MCNPSIPQIAFLLILQLDVAINLKNCCIIFPPQVLIYNLKELMVHLSIMACDCKQFQVVEVSIDEKAHLYITFQMGFPKK